MLFTWLAGALVCVEFPTSIAGLMAVGAAIKLLLDSVETVQRIQNNHKAQQEE